MKQQVMLLLFTLILTTHFVAGQTIWPLPQQYSTSENLLLIEPQDFRFQIDPDNQQCNIVSQAIARYLPVIFDRRCPGDASPIAQPSYGYLPHPLLRNVSISFATCEEFPYDGMDESYSIKIPVGSQATLTAPSTWGVIRGLETLSQMIYAANGTLEGMFLIRSSNILDFPRFQYRGLMIDTSRHFIPIAVLKQNLDAMSQNKLNVFHWHIVDDQSFPYQSIKFPQIHQQGAYNNRTHVYSQQDVQGIIEYARLRGIRVIPEYDTPGHTLSWNAIPNLLTECCTGNDPNGKFGPMNPILNSTYEFLNEFMGEVAQVFPDKVLHVGGDEVDFACWESNPQIRQYMVKEGLSESYQLQQMFMARLMDITDRLNKDHIVWEEVFNKGARLSQRSIVHVWLGNWQDEWQAKLKEITGSGIKAILSSPWYLNHIGYGIEWDKFYQVEPLNFYADDAQKKLVIGGSVCMWSEFVDGGEIIARTWPRASAVAERLWSSADARKNWWTAQRIQNMQCLMQQRGLRVGTINGPYACACDHVFN